MMKKVNKCPECQDIEDDQYTCTTCWGEGGAYMYVEPCETCGARSECECGCEGRVSTE